MNRKTKWSHRLLALALAAVMCCSVFPVGAFAETPLPQESTVATEEQQTDETETDNGQTDASNPDPGATTEESAAPTTDEPAEENEPYTFDGEILYADMPDAPTGSYIGSYGLPVATGEIKIGLSAWDADLEQDSYLSAEALDSDNLTLTTPLLEDTDYAIVPILAQVEYPADGSTLDLILPDGVTLLDYYGAPAENAESLLHNEYSETSAAVLGVYVQADADFTAQLVYTAPDGSCLTKTLQVTIDRNVTAEYPFPDSEIAAFAERPTPAVTSGKITKVAKVNGTWLIWFNGEPAYCCTHGANGQPAGCPTYTYVNTSTVNADQCIPGDHYGNQIRIWGGLNQLSLGDADDLPAVFFADEGEEISLLDFCASIYDDVQMYIIENFPESTTAEIYLASADELLNGVETYASARGYYTYIYNPGRAGWQTVALIGPEIGEEEPEPEPVVQEYYASWEAPAQTASGSFDFSYGVRTDKIQTATLEKVDGATIEIEPTTKSGSIEGGNWSISPAGKQTVTTSGHTADDNYQKNGGDASASWSLHYAAQSKQQAHLYSDLAAVRKQDTQQETASEPEKQASYQNLYWENTDMVGWILIEDTNIDYPVMQTPTDPTYYLKHDFEKNYTDYGCPFMQADCDALAPSDNLILYGHNMKDGSMFADLAKYRSKDFWQSHKTVWFDTALGSCAYEIFAVIHTTVQADTADAFPFYRFVDAATPEEFADYVSACQARALYDTGISAKYGDKLLTLSTCDNITDNGRLLVIAKKTKQNRGNKNP